MTQNLSINDEKKKEKVKEILTKLGNIMETLMVQTDYLIEI